MFADFLPSEVADIQEQEAIALLVNLRRRAIQITFDRGQSNLAQFSVEIPTAYVRYSPNRSASLSEASPIVLLHGFDSSLLEFRHLLPEFAAQRETWALDLFGFGFTDYVATIPVNPDNIRRHLLRVLESWIDRPVILVGASLGGAVAIDFALHHPDWVKSLILIDSVGFSGSFPVGQFLPHPLIELGAHWLYLRKKAALTAALALPMIEPRLIDRLRCSILHQEMPGWKAAIASFTESGGYTNLRDSIPQVKHPTLILWGEADDVLGTEDGRKFEQAIHNSRLIWIPRAGHAPHFDRPQEVAAHLLNFVRQNENFC